MTPAERDAAVARLVAQAVEQGLPAKVDDDDTYRRVAALIQPPAGHQGAA